MLKVRSNIRIYYEMLILNNILLILNIRKVFFQNILYILLFINQIHLICYLKLEVYAIII